MIKSKKKFVLLLAILSVTVCGLPMTVNAAENTVLNDTVLSLQENENQYINNSGKIKNAIFYSNGIYLYNGCKSVNAEEGLYYNNGTRDKLLGDYDVSDLKALGSKYAVVSKNESDFLVDLATGQVIENETLREKLNSISYDLKDNLTSTSRYGEFDGDVEIKTLSNNRYMDPMYQYFAVPSEDSQGNNDSAYMFDGGLLKAGLFGFTNEQGDYIDITKTANVYVYSSKLGRVCCVENYNELDLESGLEVKLAGQAKVLCQDENYLYVMVGVSINDTNNPNSSQANTVYAFIQKISKAAGEQYDGAYLPESVESYEVTSQYKVVSNSNQDSAYNLAVLSSVEDPDYYRAPFNAACSVKDGYIYITQVSKDKNKVRVNKIKLADENVHYKPEGGMLLARSMDIGYRTKDWQSVETFNAKVAEVVAQSEEQDITNFTNFSPISKNSMELFMIISGWATAPNVFPDLPVGSVAFDNEGDIWALNNGQIMKYSPSENKFNVVYTCAENMNKMKVYDDNNLMVWNEEDDVYSVIKDGQFKEDVASSDEDNQGGNEGEEQGNQGQPTGNITLDGIVYNLYSDYAEAIDYNGWVNEINIPESITVNGQDYPVTAIGDNAFDYSSSVAKLTIPDSVTFIGKEAFLGCPCLKEVKLSENLTSISARTFKDCTTLKNISIGNQVVSIEENAFENCQSLESATLGSKVENIEKEAFIKCTTLGKVTMKDSVTEIKESAFEGCRSLVNIRLSNNLTALNDKLFKECRTLMYINIPNKVESIGNEVFSGCHSLRELKIPSSVKTIGVSAVSGCSSLINTVIPSTVTSIYTGAFENCNGNEASRFYVGNQYIKDSLIRDGISEFKIKFIGSGSSSGGGSSSKDDEDAKDDKEQEQEGGNTEVKPDDSKVEEEKKPDLGWYKNGDGKWLYYDSLGNSLKGKWVLDNKNWYYLDENGYMAVGWIKLNGTWYYLNNNGSMKTGWLQDNGQWYYLTNDGSMKIGWINTGDNWYYLSEHGNMLYDTTIDGYYVDETGAWVH